VSAAIVNVDGRTQAILRGDGATETSFEIASDKAYTVVMLGATRNEDSISGIVGRMSSNPTASWGSGNVGGAPGIDDDEVCAKAGFDKIRARLK
jgi:uncharacterized protein GlcG (DUF336 family)